MCWEGVKWLSIGKWLSIETMMGNKRLKVVFSILKIAMAYGISVWFKDGLKLYLDVRISIREVMLSD